MSPYVLESSESTVLLKLSGELGIEQVRGLYQALSQELRPGKTLQLEASGLKRLDSAALQTLLAAADYASTAQLLGPAPAFEDGLRRYALENPFAQAN